MWTSSRNSSATPSFPTLKVGKQSFRGFEPAAYNNLLDLAGYPKSAAYGSKPSGGLAK